MTQLYTPWMTQAGQTVGNVIAQQGQNKLYSSAYMGEPGAMERLMQVNPAMGQQLIQQKQQAEQLKMEQSAQLEEKRKNILTEKRTIIQDYAKNMAKFETFEEANQYKNDELARLKESDPDLAMAIGDGELTPEHFKQLKSVYGEKPKEPEKLDQFQGLIKSWKEAPEGSEEKRLLEAKIGKEVAQAGGMRISYDAEGRPIIETGGAAVAGGNIPLDKPNAREAQKEVMSTVKSLERLDQIEKDFDPSFLTYGGKMKNWASATAEKIGVDLPKEDATKVKQYRKWAQNVDYEFNAYRSQITGAAAAVAELDRLKTAMLNTDLSKSQWEGAMESYKEELKRSVRLKNRFLREGIDVSDKEGGKQYDQAFLSGQDDQGAMVRGEELEAQGIESDEIVNVLQSEGYL